MKRTFIAELPNSSRDSGGKEGWKMSERIQKLRDRMVSAVPSVCTDRARIITAYYKKYEAEPPIIKRALALKGILEEMSIYIGEEELLAGNQASVPRAAPVFPEYAYEYILEELDTLENRESDRFYVRDKNKAVLREILPWWKGRTLKERAEATQSADVMRDKTVGVLGWSGNVSSGEGHIVPDYEMLLREGFPGMLKRVEAYLFHLDESQIEELRKERFYRACRAALEGCIAYIGRFRALAKKEQESCEDEKRKKELEQIACNCAVLEEGAPQTFYEALQCVWFLHVILHIESNGHSISFGRLDQYLYPFLEKDLREGRITEEWARELVASFFIKIYGNNKLRSWSTSRTQIGSPTYQNICLGGQTKEGRDASNLLTYICLDTVGEVRLPEPNVYFRIYEGTPEPLLRKVIEILKLGLGSPALINDQVVIPTMQRLGCTKEDAFNYTSLGCTEVQIPGKWSYRPNGKSKINLGKILTLALSGGRDEKSGVQVMDLKPLKKCRDFSEVLENYKTLLQYYMKLEVIADNVNEMAMEELVPDALMSVFVHNCLERGKSIKEGGVIYDIISGTLVGVPTVGNALYAVKTLVYDEKCITPEQLQNALENDYAGEKGEYIRQALLNRAPKYGNDDDEVDRFVVEITNWFAGEIEKYRTPRFGRGPIGCHYTSSTVTVTAHIPSGAAVGATPDGRRANTPLSDGASPSSGTAVKGPTAVLKSLSKFPTEMFAGGQMLNMRINPSSIADEAGEQKFAALLRGFSDLKCWHIQFNLISGDTLRAAQKNPEAYRDLIVRVAGYCALFTTLNKELQDDIIKRTEFSL